MKFKTHIRGIEEKTQPPKPVTLQLDIFNEKIDLEKLIEEHTPEPVVIQEASLFKTPIEMVTIKTDKKLDISNLNIATIMEKVEALIKRLHELGDLNAHYQQFKIPKASGGLRTITAPDDILKEIQSEIKHLIEYDLKMLPHNASYAYCKTRSVKNAIEVHQRNKSKWFLKLDMKDFFPSCDRDTIGNNLSKLFPLSEMSTIVRDNILYLITTAGLLNNGLPQGTPLSPILTNLIMVPFDTFFTDWAYSHQFRYTRYADDMIISSIYNFKFDIITEVITEMLQDLHYPFTINKEKTRYGSINGSNWNLGLMLNKDNNITIGAKNKKRLIQTLFNFIKKYDNWSKEDTQVLSGNLEWYRANEPEAYENTVNWFNKKHKVNIKTLIKQKLREK